MYYPIQDPTFLSTGRFRSTFLEKVTLAYLHRLLSNNLFKEYKYIPENMHTKIASVS